MKLTLEEIKIKNKINKYKNEVFELELKIDEIEDNCNHKIIKRNKFGYNECQICGLLFT